MKHEYIKKAEDGTRSNVKSFDRAKYLITFLFVR